MPFEERLLRQLLIDESDWLAYDPPIWNWPVVPRRRIIIEARTAQEISESYNP